MNRQVTLLALALGLTFAAAALAAVPSASRAPGKAPAVATPAAAAPATRPAAGPAEPWDTYRVLAQRNIFVRDRSRLSTPPRSRGPSNRSVYLPTGPGDQAMVLTGVGQGDEEGQAFVEDPATGTTYRTWAGQPLAAGRVAAVTLDGIEYEQRGVKRKIKVGQDLTGVEVAIAAPAPIPAALPPVPAPGGGPGAAGGPGERPDSAIGGEPRGGADGAARRGSGGDTRRGSGDGAPRSRGEFAGPGASPGSDSVPGAAGRPPAGDGGAVSAARGGPPAATAAPPAGAPVDDAGMKAILERMRQRRLQETK
jgi:hypothetical protein